MYVCCIGMCVSCPGMLRDRGREGERHGRPSAAHGNPWSCPWTYFPGHRGKIMPALEPVFSPFHARERLNHPDAPVSPASRPHRCRSLVRVLSGICQRMGKGSEPHSPPPHYTISLCLSLLPLYMAPRTRYDDCSRAFFFSIICRIINYSAGEIISTAPHIRYPGHSVLPHHTQQSQKTGCNISK